MCLVWKYIIKRTLKNSSRLLCDTATEKCSNQTVLSEHHFHTQHHDLKNTCWNVKWLLLEFTKQLFDNVLLICSNNLGSKSFRLKSPSTTFISEKLLRISKSEKNAGIVDEETFEFHSHCYLDWTEVLCEMIYL